MAEAHMGLSILKEGLGFAGSIIAAIPWFRDFWRRLRIENTKRINAGGSLKSLLNDIKAHDEGWLAKPKGIDLLCMAAGLAMLAASFLIGVGLLLCA